MLYAKPLFKWADLADDQRQASRQLCLHNQTSYKTVNVTLNITSEVQLCICLATSYVAKLKTKMIKNQCDINSRLASDSVSLLSSVASITAS